jgi:hypothetical protein
MTELQGYLTRARAEVRLLAKALAEAKGDAALERHRDRRSDSALPLLKQICVSKFVY